MPVSDTRAPRENRAPLVPPAPPDLQALLQSSPWAEMVPSCPLSPDQEDPPECLDLRETRGSTENQVILVRMERPALKDLQDSQGLPEILAPKETREIVERVSLDPEDHPDLQDLQDQGSDRRLWTWRALVCPTWRLSGASPDSQAPPALPVLPAPLPPALL